MQSRWASAVVKRKGPDDLPALLRDWSKGLTANPTNYREAPPAPPEPPELPALPPAEPAAPPLPELPALLPEVPLLADPVELPDVPPPPPWVPWFGDVDVIVCEPGGFLRSLIPLK